MMGALIFFLVFILIFLVLFWHLSKKTYNDNDSETVSVPKWSLKSWYMTDICEYHLTFENETEVRGSCTVWHYYPSGQRCSTSVQLTLCDIWHRLKWGLDNDKRIEPPKK